MRTLTTFLGGIVALHVCLADAGAPSTKAPVLKTVKTVKAPQTQIKKVGNVTSVVEDVPPVPPKCRITVATAPKSTDEALTLWFYVPQDGVEVESEEPNKLVVLVPVGPERDYHFMWSAREPKGKQKTERVTVKAGKGPRPPPNPDPDPDPQPDPDGKPLIDDPANHVLFVYETGDQASYTQGQIGFMYSQEVRAYLTEKCPKSANSSGWYMLDKDAVTTALPAHWSKAMAKPRSKLPYMILSTPRGGWEGPIPERFEDAFAKLKEVVK